MKPHTARQLLKKKADMIKYTKDKVKMSAYLDEWEKISKKRKKGTDTWEKVKAYSPLAGVGALIGLGKGTAEKAIETRAEKHLPKRYRSLSRGIGKGTTGAVSTLIIGLTMADLLQKAKKKAKGG